MSTSNPIVSRIALRAATTEAAGAALLLNAAMVLASPNDLWLNGVGFHPAWIAILVLAARYGLVGLFASMVLTWGGLLTASLVLGGSLADAAARASNPADVLAMTAAVIVAWVAMLHEGRVNRLTRQLVETEIKLHTCAENRATMTETLAFLRARQDRLDVSLSMWRDIAPRLERGDAAEAARAALELCTIRSGATAGVVHAWDGQKLVTLASRGPSTPARRGAANDRTCMAAITRGRATPATEVIGVSGEDCDIAVPVLDGKGKVCGVIALRGVSADHIREADLSDLKQVAAWLSPSMARPVRGLRLLKQQEMASAT